MIEVGIVILLSSFSLPFLLIAPSKYSVPIAAFFVIWSIGLLYGGKPTKNVEYVVLPFIEGITVLKNQLTGSVAILEPADQSAVTALVSEAVKRASTLRDQGGGAQRLVWVEANQRLCSAETLGFDVFKIHNDWVVQLKSSGVSRDGSLRYVDVQASSDVTLSLRPIDAIPLDLVVDSAIGTQLRITGSFQRGDMRVFECLLAARVFGGRPELNRNRIIFNLISMEAVR
jgi:hypothetical protein